VSFDCLTDGNFVRQRHVEKRPARITDRRYSVPDDESFYQSARMRHAGDVAQSVHVVHSGNLSSQHEMEYETVDEVSGEEMQSRTTVEYHRNEADRHNFRQGCFKIPSRQVAICRSRKYEHCDSDSDGDVNENVNHRLRYEQSRFRWNKKQSIAHRG
jgi:hypothetical protein